MNTSRVWRVLFASLLIVESAAGSLLYIPGVSFAAFTATQSGNWASTSTWGGSGPPGNGDTANLGGFIVTITTPVTVGTSGAVGTVAITAPTTSQLVLTGGTLAIRGDYQGHGSSSLTPLVVMNPGSAWEFDSSAAAAPSTTPYKFISDSSFTWVFLNATCTKLSPCVMRSNAGGANGFVDGSNAFLGESGGIIARYVTFLRLGSSTQFAWRAAPGNGNVLWDVQHCTMDTTGTFGSAGSSAGTWPANSVYRHEFNVHQNGLDSSLYASFTGSVGTGERTIAFNVFDQLVGQGANGFGTAAWQDVNVHDNFFYGSYVSATSGVWASWQNNFMRKSPVALPTGIISAGDMTDTYYLTDTFTLLHDHVPDVTPAVTTFSFLRNIIDATAFQQPFDGSDGIVEDTATCHQTTITVLNNIILAIGDGSPAGGLMDLWGPCGSIWDVEHNTLQAGGLASCTTMECEDSSCAMPALGINHRGTLSNNICYSPQAFANTAFIGNYDIENPITGNDLFLPANIQKNVRFNIKLTNPSAPHNPPNQGNGYIGGWTSTPGGSDLLVNPNFVSTGRNMATFDTAYLGHAAGAQWVTSHAYNVGDIVSDPQASYYASAVINYRCIAGHTSGASTEPGIGSSWHTDWEFSSLNDIRVAMVADPQLTINGDTYTVAMMKWIRAGFAPTNQALKGAATDGGDIGAVPVVSGNQWLVGGSSINGAKLR